MAAGTKTSLQIGNAEQVGFEDDWDIVGVSETMWYYRSNVTFEDGRVRKVNTKSGWVEDTEAQAELEALVAKWDAEGKSDLRECLTDEGTFVGDYLGHTVQTEWISETPIDECTFWKIVPIQVRIMPHEKW